jgi:hypothetical protein
MSEIKVNKLSPRTNCGTVQLGDSGDTITIPAGVTITNNGTAAGFGATGAASWDTTVKTSGFTAVSGVGYFVDTTAGAISVNLPAGVAGAVVAIKDYANTFDTNNVTLVQNGSDKIGGSTVNATLDVEGIAVTLVFVDSTQGWLVTDSGLQNEAPTALYVIATGGTITCSGDYRIHTFTGPGTFCVSCAGNAGGSNAVDYMVIAGGGASWGPTSPGNTPGGGGAGGFRETPGTVSGSYTVSPLAGGSAFSVSATSYPVTVGAGGAPAQMPSPGGSGSPSTALSLTSTGGGGSGFTTGLNGGSGGGSGYSGPSQPTGGLGNTPPTSPPQGFPGGGACGPPAGGGGGGGATVAGANRTGGGAGGAGGAGATTSISGSSVTRAGGGGGGGQGGPGAAGVGGGGLGGSPSITQTDGTANTGGGAGGAGPFSPISSGQSGGSGIVIIRYKFQN